MKDSPASPPPGGSSGRDEPVDRTLGEDAWPDRSIDGLGAAELGRLCVATEVEIARLQARQAAALARFDALQGYEDDGGRSTAGWLAPRAGITKAAAGARMKVARRLRVMPSVAASWARGRIGYAKAQLFATFVTDATLDDFERDQEVLVDLAERHTHDELREILLRWAALADPEGHEQDEARRHRQRAVYLSPSWAGGGDLHGLLDAEAFLVVAQVLANIAAEMRRADKEQLPLEQRRTESQLRHDALVEMARRAAAWKAETMPAANPVLTLVASWALLQAGGAIVTEHGQPIAAETAKRWACQAGISPMLLGPEGEPLHLGRATRLFSPAQRRAIAARDGGCCFLGCNEPPESCDAHHTEEWTADQGPTDVEKGVLACRTAGHHRALHEGGFRAVRGNGVTTVYRPDGTVLEDPRMAMRDSS